MPMVLGTPNIQEKTKTTTKIHCTTESLRGEKDDGGFDPQDQAESDPTMNRGKVVLGD
ncbi:hypothetical protein Scep_002040 [Stephania cephalantha]|uniref:Uncharacterized protein n=1 Tax=Stephania cephalantha TaxID=152367 RepID=A0AAP0LD15_9MAGN